MSDYKKVLELDNEEYGTVIHCLNDKRSELIAEDKPTDGVDELLIKVIDAPSKKDKYRYEERR